MTSGECTVCAALSQLIEVSKHNVEAMHAILKRGYQDHTTAILEERIKKTLAAIRKAEGKE